MQTNEPKIDNAGMLQMSVLPLLQKFHSLPIEKKRLIIRLVLDVALQVSKITETKADDFIIGALDDFLSRLPLRPKPISGPENPETRNG